MLTKFFVSAGFLPSFVWHIVPVSWLGWKRWTLDDFLGAGAFGQSYLATHEPTGHRYVMKFLSRDNDRELKFLKQVTWNFRNGKWVHKEIVNRTEKCGGFNGMEFKTSRIFSPCSALTFTGLLRLLAKCECLYYTVPYIILCDTSIVSYVAIWYVYILYISWVSKISGLFVENCSDLVFGPVHHVTHLMWSLIWLSLL